MAIFVFTMCMRHDARYCWVAWGLKINLFERERARKGIFEGLEGGKGKGCKYF